MMNFMLYIPSPTVSSFSVGTVDLHIYSLFILVGAFLLSEITTSRFVRSGGSKDAAASSVFWLILPIILGARAWHVITRWQDYASTPEKIPIIWEGGLGFMGGMLGGIVTVWFLSRKYNFSMPLYLDAAAPGILLAISMARMGNYFNNEAFGLPTDLPWGLELSVHWQGVPTDQRFHPLFLYEILWNMLVLLVILLLKKRLALPDGGLFALFLIGYGAGRLWTEPLRYPLQENLFGIEYNYLAAITMVVVGTIWLVRLLRSRRSGEVSVQEPPDLTAAK